MKKYIYFIGALLASGTGFAQVVETQLVARMGGYVDMHDGTEIRIMNYRETPQGPDLLPSPTLYYTEGDSVQIELYNLTMSAPHTVHLHGLDVDQANDGVPHLSFEVWHQEHGYYNFIAPHPGTYIYHCHVVSTVHVQAGMYGMLIVRPQGNQNVTWDGGYSFDSEQTWMTSEVDPFWHTDDFITTIHDSTMMQFALPPLNPEYFLINGLSEQQLTDEETAINIEKDEVRYLHVANIGNYGNEIVFPSELNAKIISSDGRPLPTPIDSDSLFLTPGERYGVLLSPTVDINDNATVAFIDLNTQTATNTQNVPVLAQWPFGVDENGAWKMEVYPNPSANEFILTGENNLTANVKVQLTDVQGKQIDPGSYNVSIGTDIKLNLGALPDATYLVKVLSADKLVYTDWLTKSSN
jgi:FtsP/CotA-like multicopper oxidase with cupredoxin domain